MQSIIKRVPVKTGIQTLMGVFGEHPIRGGNQFTIKMCDDNWAWVQNISVEDFQEICKRENLYSVLALYLPEHDKCFIIDERIPLDWYREYAPFKKSKLENISECIDYTFLNQHTSFQDMVDELSVEDYSDEDEQKSMQLEFKFSFKDE